MNLSNFGATCRTFLGAVALASLAVPSSAQIVERSRTLADLLASHPCTDGLAGRHTIVTDCDAADDLGDGEGAFSCFARCDGIDTWAAVAIGAGGGGLPGADEVTEAMLKSVNACTDEYVLTCETTTGDFEWQPAATGTIGGTLTATDDLAVCTDGTGGSTIGACTVLNIDNLRLDANTVSATNTDGALTLASNGSGLVSLSPAGIARMTLSSTGVSIVGGTDYALYANSTGAQKSIVVGTTREVEANTAGSGAPNNLANSESTKLLTNEGSTAKNYHTLVTAGAGISYTLCVQDADGMRIVANTSDTIRVIDKVTAAAGYIESTTIGSCWSGIAINAVEWFTTAITGTWTDGTFTYDDTSLTTP